MPINRIGNDSNLSDDMMQPRDKGNSPPKNWNSNYRDTPWNQKRAIESFEINHKSTLEAQKTRTQTRKTKKTATDGADTLKRSY